MLKKISLLMALLTCVSITVLATDNAGAFLENGTGSRAIGLGYSGVALLDGVDAVYWNPANLLETDTEIQLTAFDAFETQFASFQLAADVGGLPVGVSYIYSGIDGVVESLATNNQIDRWTASGTTFGSFQHAVLLSTAIALMDAVSVGVTGKALYQTIHSKSAYGIGADLGLNISITQALALGVNIQNIVKPGLVWNTDSKNMDSIPTNYKVGLAYTSECCATSFDANLRTNRPTRYSVGAEFYPVDSFVFRAGFTTDSEKMATLKEQVSSLSGLSLGCGINLDPMGINFSWTNPELDVMDHMYRVSFGYTL